MPEPTLILIVEIEESAQTAPDLEARFRTRIEKFASVSGAKVTLQQNGTIRESGSAAGEPLYSGTRTYEVELPTPAPEPELTPEPEPEEPQPEDAGSPN